MRVTGLTFVYNTRCTGSTLVYELVSVAMFSTLLFDFNEAKIYCVRRLASGLLFPERRAIKLWHQFFSRSFFPISLFYSGPFMDLHTRLAVR